jgi:uncharacterized membrane protein
LEVAVRPASGDAKRTARSLRSLATFLVAAGAVLAIVVAVFSLRDWLSPPKHTWSVWTGGALVALGVAAAVLWIAGALLSRRVHRERRDSVASFLTPSEREQVAEAIRKFESSTSGEIRVHLAARTGGEPKATAARVFDRVGMARTRDRNGVLFFVSIRDRRLAVIGDRGIHAAVPSDFWSSVIARVESHFSQGRFADGLVDGIGMAGNALSRHFPPRPDDVNELPDAITDSRTEEPE